MEDKEGVDESLPLNKYLTKHKKLTGLTMADMSSMTGIDYFKIYRIRIGKRPSLLTASTLEYFTGGEIKCSDLLPPKLAKKFKEHKEKVDDMKKKFEVKIA